MGIRPRKRGVGLVVVNEMTVGYRDQLGLGAPRGVPPTRPLGGTPGKETMPRDLSRSAKYQVSAYAPELPVTEVLSLIDSDHSLRGRTAGPFSRRRAPTGQVMGLPLDGRVTTLSLVGGDPYKTASHISLSWPPAGTRPDIALAPTSHAASSARSELV